MADDRKPNRDLSYALKMCTVRGIGTGPLEAVGIPRYDRYVSPSHRHCATIDSLLLSPSIAVLQLGHW